MSYCDKKVKPEFTAEQQTECRTKNNGRPCTRLSDKKIWCCLFGCRIDGRPEITRPTKRIIQPSKKILLPNNRQPCDEKDFERDYQTAMSGHQGYNGELINLVEYVTRRTACKICPEKITCPMRGCSRWRVLIEKARKCPKGKW